ncbi:MAG TPA: hypothetical protein VND91_07905 [Candidatus Saccharimonadia bacterium]|nr:hypothetical protein [Candidatus Saccharimonadia bacterium]
MAAMIQGFSLTILVDNDCDARINAVSRQLLAEIGRAAGGDATRVFVESLATMPGERTFVVSLDRAIESGPVVAAVARVLADTGTSAANNAITAFPEFHQFRVVDTLPIE